MASDPATRDANEVEFVRALRCLELELPASVYGDFAEKSRAYMGNLAAAYRERDALVARLAVLEAERDAAEARATQEASLSMKQAVKLGEAELRFAKLEAEHTTLRDALHGWQGFYHGGYLVGIAHESTASELAHQGAAALSAGSATGEEHP